VSAALGLARSQHLADLAQIHEQDGWELAAFSVILTAFGGDSVLFVKPLKSQLARDFSDRLTSPHNAALLRSVAVDNIQCEGNFFRAGLSGLMPM
jgi:hypothetical protein